MHAPAETAARRPILIDCDPGLDDAAAILMALGAADRLDLRAVTTVAGNVGLQAVTANARGLLALAGRDDAPVFAGCPRPLIGGDLDAAHVHGADGIGGCLLYTSEERGLTWFASSEVAERGFCSICGGNLFYRRRDPAAAALSIMAGTLDQPSGLKTAVHIFTAGKADYYDIADGLPRRAHGVDSDPIA